MSALLLACLLILAVSTPPVLADDTSLGGVGGDLRPLTSTSVRLEAETVQAVLYRRFAEFRVDFRFVNAGDAQRLLLGFPYLLPGPDDNGIPPVAFRAWQDGQPLAVRTGESRHEGAELGYFLHEATFPPGKTMITVSYLSVPTWSSGDRFPELAPPEMRIGNVAFLAGRYDYWLHTGASWAGTIGKAIVRFALADECDSWGFDIKSNHPLVQEGWPWTTKPETYLHPDARTFAWEFRDFEPTENDDIRLAFTAPFLTEPASDTLPPVFGAVLTPLPEASADTGDQSGGPAAAVDGSPLSAWKIDQSAGQAWSEFRVNGNRDIAELRLLPGLNQSPTSFFDNGRPKSVRVILADGTTRTVSLADEPTVQVFPLAGRTDRIRLELLEVYPGSKSSEVFLSELSLGARSAPRFLPFDQLLAEGPTTPSSYSTTTQATGSVSSIVDQTGPQQTLGSQGPEEQANWPVWSVVAFAVAGAAFLVLLALVLLAAKRR